MSKFVFIVVKDEGAYSDREVFNEAVFDTKEKAVEYVISKGYKFNQDYNEYTKTEKTGYSESYRIEEWEINSILKD